MIAEARAMSSLDMTNFAIAYASTVMPIRAAVERGRWNDAANMAPPVKAPPAVVAIAVWSRGIGLAHSGHPAEAREQAGRLRQIEKQLRDSNDDYWAIQTAILADEVMAWANQAAGHPADAETLLRAAAEKEDALEKRPVTPGPVVPAREQLGDLLLQNGKRLPAREAFAAALVQAPGRRGALLGEARADRAAP